MTFADVQSLVIHGFVTLEAGRYLLLEAGETSGAKAALARILPRIGFGRPSSHRHEVVQLAITSRGLTRLGLGEAALASFPVTFQERMDAPHRLRSLGDVGANHPDNWAWSGDDTDVMLILFAADTPTLDALEASVLTTLAPGFSLRHRLPAVALEDKKEHFGFRDGISQPQYRGVRGDKAEDLAIGELVLGYPDEHGELPPRPKDGDFDLGKDGTYMVFRQLAQDVAGFWNAAKARGGGDEGALWLAAKMMGRWPDGTPVSRTGPDDPQPENPDDAVTFRDDARGLGCPRGAHIRRANPRDGLSPTPEASLVRMRRHRMLRRGRAYGPPAPAEAFPQGLSVHAKGVAPAEGERGLYFACLVGDLGRQFELVQQSWLNNAKHEGLVDEVCPISAGRDLRADARTFTIPEEPLRRRVHEWPTVVTVRGSAYLFLPGRAALEHLAR